MSGCTILIFRSSAPKQNETPQFAKTPEEGHYPKRKEMRRKLHNILGTQKQISGIKKFAIANPTTQEFFSLTAIFQSQYQDKNPHSRSY